MICISLSVLPAVCTIQCRHSILCRLSVSARDLCDSMPVLDTMPPLDAMPALHGAMMALGTIQCRRSVAAARFDAGARCESMPALHSMPPLGACDAAARFGVTPYDSMLSPETRESRVDRIAPNRADGPRDSTIRQNTRLGDSAIRRFGNSF